MHKVFQRVVLEKASLVYTKRNCVIQSEKKTHGPQNPQAIS